MPRQSRAAEGGLVYHALNRSNGRAEVFGNDGDYAAFENILSDAVLRFEMRLLAYCVLPNHFHLLLWPRHDGDLSRFMRWLTLTHTQRWHTHHQTVGSGHLYQGRYKSFPVQNDEHFYTVCRYVERNALRAGLVTRAEQWRWGSLWWTGRPRANQPGPRLSSWPIERPPNWIARVNVALSPAEEEAFARSLNRSQPFGTPQWQARTAKRLGIESSLRPLGRPRNEPEERD